MSQPLEPSQLDSLPAALAAIGIELPADQVAALDRYRELLWDWNEKLNLTRHTTFEKFATRDVLDTLELAKLIPQDEEVLDIGTGGGVPGVILAIVRPDLQVSLCESVTKRAKVVEEIVDKLELKVPVHNERAEDHLEEFRYNTAVARGVAPLWKMLSWLDDRWDAVGQLLMIKGSKWAEERAAARERGLTKQLEMRKASEYTTPGSGAENVVLKIWRKGKMPRE